MIMGIVQTIGDMHFLGNFFDFMDGMDEVFRGGEIPTSLVDKGVFHQAVVPKYATQIAHGIGYLKGQESGKGFHGIKNANTIMEKITKDVAALRGTDKEGNSLYDNLGGDTWNWLTGEKVTEDMQYWSGYAKVDAPETYDPVFEELVRMDVHLAAPQRYLPDLGITLTPNEMTKYQQLTGTLRATINGKRRTLYEALEYLMNSPRYNYSETRDYPNNPGVRNWRVEKCQQIIQKYKAMAFKRLLATSPELKELWRERKTELHNQVRMADDPKQIKSIYRHGFVGDEEEEHGDFGSEISKLWGGDEMGPRPSY